MTHLSELFLGGFLLGISVGIFLGIVILTFYLRKK